MRSVRLDPEAGGDDYPFTVPAIRDLGEVEFAQAVTFLVGENGSGKSTFLEGLALATEAKAAGRHDLARDETLSHADRLGRAEDEMKKTLDATVKRRNDIVHRADRSQDDTGGEAQEIGYAWTRQAVDTIRVVCLCLDELVAESMKEFRAEAAALETQGAA